MTVGKRRARGRRANRVALLAAVLGALSLPVGVLGPLAIVVGLRARRAGGGWPALAAIIAGSLSTGFLLLGIVHYLLAVFL